MKKNGLWTVNEVCKLTRLTRKHLSYFHGQEVVLPAAFSNFSVQGHSGYKLYDDVGVAKLQQIAMYYELGLKRDEIRDLMKATDYDADRALDKLKADLEEKRARLDQYIATIEQLRLIGTKNGILQMFRGTHLIEWGKNVLAMPTSFREWCTAACADTQKMDLVSEPLERLLIELSQLDCEELVSDPGMRVIEAMLRTAIQHLGLVGYVFIFGFFLSVMGDGSLAKEIVSDMSIVLTENHGKAAMDYLKQDLDLLLDEVAEVVACHHEVIGAPFDTPEAVEMTEAIKELLANHFGIKGGEEYHMVFEILEIEPYTGKKKDYLNYTLNALKYHATRP